MATLGHRAPPEDDAHGFRPGGVVGDRFELVAMIRVSHLGARWSAWDRQLERRVTLKLLAPYAVTDPVAGEWLRRESRATARIHHPNVLQLYDVHSSDGIVALVLEDADGPSLDDVGRGPHPADVVAAVGQQVAGGLAAAHLLRVVHRDVRPANLLVAPSGHVKVANFTLSKLLDSSGQGVTIEASLRDQFGYVAPEQLAGAPVGPAADVYALGLILWEALNGHLPWQEAEPLPSAALRRTREPLPPATDAADAVAGRLADVIERATRPDPASRPSARALAEELREVGGTRPHEVTRSYYLRNR